MLRLLSNADCHAPEHLGHRHLLIAGERIVWMGAEPPPLGAAVEVEIDDLEGRRVIPGLVDGHVHVTGGGGESGPESRVPAPPLGRYTRAGVTTVVGLLGTDDLTRSIGELLTRVRGLEAEGLSAWCYTGGYHLPLTTLTGSARGDIVYLDKVIGVGELAISDHRSSQPTDEELLRVASEAHVAGLMTGKAGTLHLHLGDGERGLEPVRRALAESELPARVFHPTHVNRRQRLFDEALALATDGPCIDITAFPVEEGATVDDELAADVALGRCLDEGVPPRRVTVSSDGGGCLPRFDDDGRVTSMEVGDSGALLECIARCCAAGRELEAVLPAFTSNVADLLRLPRKGRVVAGGDADLVVLDDDGSARDVMARGTWHRRGGRQLEHGTFE